MLKFYVWASDRGTNNTSNKIPRLFRLVKLLRVIRLAKLLPRLEDAILLNPALLRFIKITAFLFCSWHWIACIYFLICDVEDFGYERMHFAREGGNSWVPPAFVWCPKIEEERCNETYWETRKKDLGFVLFEGLNECFDSGRCPGTYRLQYLHAFYWVRVLFYIF